MGTHVRFGCRRVLALTALAVLCGPALFGQAISVRGSLWSFVVKAPEGWVQDRRSLFRSGIEALLVPSAAAGASSASGAFRLDGIFLLIAPPGAALPTAVIDGAAAPTGRMETASFQEVRLYSRIDAQPESSDAPELHRLFGVLDSGAFRFIFLLSAPSAEELEATRPAMEQLVESFVLLGGRG